MLELITHPVMWLLLGAVGWCELRIGERYRGVPTILVSSLVLLSYCGLKTWLVYTGLGLVVCALSYVAALRAWGIAGCTVLLVAYLACRKDMALSIPFLPSLSYFAFRGIALLVESRSVAIPWQHRVLTLTFFPILMTGPIVRSRDFAWQSPDGVQALHRLVIGLIFLLLGYTLAPWVLPGHRLLTENVALLWRSSLANTFKLYLDFAGYTEFVIGLGCLCGYRLPENFNNPYMSPNIAVFWRRWHMSLSFWIRDFIYIPLGGSKHGQVRKIVLLIGSMAICGIWHGLSLNFLIWGVYHGVLLVVHHGWSRYRPRLNVFESRLWHGFSMMLTFLMVSMGWIIFTYTWHEAWVCIQRMM